MYANRSTYTVIPLLTVHFLQSPGPVFTATAVYHTIIDEPPYLVDRTTVVVWTESPSAIPSSSYATA